MTEFDKAAKRYIEIISSADPTRRVERNGFQYILIREEELSLIIRQIIEKMEIRDGE